MKKFGFTLAEILIALGIIGVVAAITIPTFVNDTRNQTNASKLASVVSDLENAFSIMITDEGEQDLLDTEFGRDSNYERLTRYLKISNTAEDLTGYYNGTASPTFNNMGHTSSLGDSTVSYLWETKNGALVMFKNDMAASITVQEAEEEGLSDTNALGVIRIDVNGSDSPNLYGRDIFSFVLSESGTLYPVGSRFYSIVLFEKNENAGLYTGDGVDSCTNATLMTANSISGEGCTARLVENNYQVNY